MDIREGPPIGISADTESNTGEDYFDILDELLGTLKTMATQTSAIDHASHGESQALLILAKATDGLSAGGLGSAMGITTGRTANILRQLEHKEFVTKTVDPANRRKAIITLTPLGVQAASELAEHLRKRILEVFRKLGREDSLELIRIMKKLARS